LSAGSVTTGRDGLAADGSIRHILLVAYLYPPCNVVPAYRPAGLRRAFLTAGVRTTVLSSEISGSYDDDAAQGIIRAGDLRTRFRTQYQTLVGYRDGALEARAKPRWWTKYIVPDPTALSWFPQALVHLLRLIRRDRPDVIITTSGPESSHLLGLVASAFGIRWVADYRDPWLPWLQESQHPAILRLLDRALERRVARGASVVTAVNDPIASDIASRHGVHAFTISNGFDRTVLAGASNEEATVDRSRFSLAHTGLLAIDTDKPVLSAAPNRARDVRAFLDALTLLLARDEELSTRLEFLVAGMISDSEREALMQGDRHKIVRVVGALPHERSLGLQLASDGLLLIPGGPDATSAKIFEYLAAGKPIFAATESDSAAARLLREAGEHTVAEPGDPESLSVALEAYLARWTAEGASYEPRSGFDLEAYEYEKLGQRLLQLIAAPGSNKLGVDSAPCIP
jgi:glycosyltransferase involved in cell wall biosynthesis